MYTGARIMQLYFAGMSTETVWDTYCHCAVASRNAVRIKHLNGS